MEVENFTNETLAKVGFDYVGFFHMPMPAQPFGWFKKNVTKVSDVKGMKYRTVGLATDVLTAMGMVVRNYQVVKFSQR